jgi:hypothetical protein
LDQIIIPIINWPANSPDLNPIENLWALIKVEIYKLHLELEHAYNIIEILDNLIEVAQEAWHTIDQGILYRLATTIDNRV